MGKLVPFLLAVCALLSLCACEGEPQTIHTAQYTLSLPDGYTTESQDDSSLLFLADNAPVGGLRSLPWEHTGDLGFQNVKDPTDDNLTPLLTALLDEGEVVEAHSFSSSLFGDVELDLHTNQRHERHYFFLQDKVVYDLWFQTGSLTEDAETAILRSFSLRT